MHSPDTIKGVLEFCDREGQPASQLELFLLKLAESYKLSGEVANIIEEELNYEDC